MRTSILNRLKTNLNKEAEQEDCSIPLNVSDILDVCKEYSKLGLLVQSQVETILDVGVEEAIESGAIKISSLPFIKDFFSQIEKNEFFGDASLIAKDLLFSIYQFEIRNNIRYIMNN